MKWCCPAFAGWYDHSGQRGIAILVGRDSTGEPEFLMQYRAVNEGEEMSFNPEVVASTVIEVGLRYCPWCGRNLDKWYGKNVDALYRPYLKITYP